MHSCRDDSNALIRLLKYYLQWGFPALAQWSLCPTSNCSKQHLREDILGCNTDYTDKYVGNNCSRRSEMHTFIA